MPDPRLVLAVLLVAAPHVPAGASTASRPPAAVVSATPRASAPPHDALHILVTFRSGAARGDRLRALAALGGREVGQVGAAGVSVVAVGRGRAAVAEAARYAEHAAVASAEPNWELSLTDVPGDPRFVDQWGLENVGQTVEGGVAGSPDVDVDAVAGWTAAYGEGLYPRQGGTRVGVIDGGVDMSHPDLDGKIAVCAGATGGTGVVEVGACEDTHGHGTHVAGTVAAVTDNGIGIAGVAPDATLAVFKAVNGTSKGFYADLIAGLNWLRTTGGARVINISLGGGPQSDAVDSELSAAADAGVLLVAAAGNTGDSNPTYPAVHPDVMSVSAVDSFGNRPSFSTCNGDVEIAAPGVDVWSTSAFGGYLRRTGTSMSAPHVAGAAAVLMSARQQGAAAVRAALVDSAVRPSGCGTVGVLNLPNALAALPHGPSPSPSASSPSPSASVAPTAVAGRGRLVVVPARRLVDTRSGGAGAGALSGGEIRWYTASAAGGVPADGAIAVAVNVTAVAPTRSTYLTVFPADAPRPTASTVNAAAGRTIAALSVVQLSPDGRFAVFNHAGATHLLLDVVGYYVDGSAPGGSAFGTLDAGRLADTRVGDRPLAAGESRRVRAAGVGGVPATGVDAVVVNITAIAPTRATYLSVFPSGSVRPATSTLNVGGSETRANLALVALGDDGSFDVFNHAGGVHVAVDVMGWYGAGAGLRFEPVAPARLHDTRTAGVGVPGGQAAFVPSAGRGGVPPDAVAVAVTVTGTEPSTTSHLSALRTGAAPTTSTLNLTRGATVANLAVVPVGSDGAIAIHNSAGVTHVVVDVVGYFLRV